MPNPIIERAARALYQLNDAPAPDVIAKLSADDAKEEAEFAETAWLNYVEDARAVLRAIREPSDAMVESGGNVQWWETIGDSGETVEAGLASDDVARVWQAMIDAALEER